MEKFLSKAAKILISGNYTGPRSVVILPNRRSEVFLKQELRKIVSDNTWLPEFLPIDEFVQKLSGISKADTITVGFDLFKSYKKKEGVNASSLDEFLSWVPMILNDFNDIDNSMVDAKEVYGQLSAIKAIEQWSPERKALTELQENYLRFYNSMYDYYIGLHDILLAKKTGYQGMINRKAAENIESLQFSWDRFLIVGINALSEAEIIVFQHINQNYHTNFVWDLDQYYFNNRENDFQHEAGKHIKKIIDRLNLEVGDDIETNLTDSHKEINILGIPKNIGQVKYIGQELKKITADEQPKTAIVLANEGLLIPLLNSLPVTAEQNGYNLTLGYPTTGSQIDYFFEVWIETMESMDELRATIKTSDLIKFINNPIVKQLIDNQKQISKHVSDYIVVNGNSNVTFSELESFIRLKSKKAATTFSALLNNCKNKEIQTALDSLMNTIIEFIEPIRKSNTIHGELLYSLTNIIGKIKHYIVDFNSIINYKVLLKISRQIFSLTTVNLVGEPLQGIQIMGMLETRTLDFDNIYVLSVNEGILPKTTSMDSFIPMDIRHEMKLPLPSDKTDIYSYHFYRLLQRSKKITLLYNSDPEVTGGGEKSRFILQIENELKNSNPSLLINQKIVNTEIVNDSDSAIKSNKIVIEKNKDILNKIIKISQTGYSASLLNSYITCGLKFYFQQILRLKIESSLEQSIEANTFGTVIHETLEKIYENQVDSEIDTDIIKSWISKSDKLLVTVFKKHYRNENLVSGKNLLIFEVAKKYIRNFLKWDIRNLTTFPAKLISTEEKITTKIKEGTITVKGTIDRVEELNSTGITRIIDYKSGIVMPTSLKVKDVAKLTKDPKLSKSFQVLYYAWLYNMAHPKANIETGIISMRSLSNGFMPLSLKEFSNISDYFKEFEESVLELIDEINNGSLPFVQTDDVERCKYCDFKSICNIPI